MAKDWIEILGVIPIVLFVSLIFIAGISVFLNRQFGIEPLRLGGLFYLILIGGAVALVWVIIKRLMFKQAFETKDFMLLILVVAGIVFLYYKLPNLVPELFSVDASLFNNLVGLR